MSSIEPTFLDFEQRGDNLRALIRDFRAGRVPHAVLLVGAAGIGKRTLARLIAKGLLCTVDSGKPCGACHACARFDARTHPDLLYPVVPQKEKTIKVEPIRDIIDALGKHAFEGGKRVVLIENAERMTPSAQNCLLKNVEEATQNTFFLFTADLETAVLPTIRSRCRVERMQPLTKDRVLQILKAQGHSGAEAQRAAALCEGSLTMARDILSNERDAALRKLVMDTFLSVSSKGTLPQIAQQLKNSKDDADKLLDILEQELRLMLVRPEGRPGAFENCDLSGIANILSAVFEARKMRFSNVNWQAISEQLLEKTAEELIIWQR